MTKVDCTLAQGPLVEPWKVLTPDLAYHGAWLVCGDLDGDGQAEVVTATRIPKTQYVATALAMKLDGTVLWKWGRANSGEPGLACDVPVQCYDMTGRSQADVYLITGEGAQDPHGRLIVLEGKTGKQIKEFPLVVPNKDSPSDCITFANFRGGPRARDLLVKSRHDGLLALTDEGQVLWKWASTEGDCSHHATPVDVDGDGKEEVFTGRCLLSPEGQVLWSHKMPVGFSVHVDSCRPYRVGPKPEDLRFAVTGCAAKYVAALDATGGFIWKAGGPHWESVDVGKVRDDVPGVQFVADIDKAPFGQKRLCILDVKDGRVLVDFLCGESRFHRLLDWDGDGLLDILAVQNRKIFNGKGECLAVLGPKDVFGEEEKANPRFGSLGLAADVDGDQRLDIILHSNKKIVVYRSEKGAKVPGAPLGTHNFTLY